MPLDSVAASRESFGPLDTLELCKAPARPGLSLRSHEASDLHDRAGDASERALAAHIIRNEPEGANCPSSSSGVSAGILVASNGT